MDQPAPKRSRLGVVFQRTIACMTGRTPGEARPKSKTEDKAAVASSAALAAGIVTGNDPVPAAVITTPTFTPAPTHSPFTRAFSPFGIFSHAGSVVAATVGSRASTTVAQRTIKVCLVGEVAAGKTALFK